MQPQSPDVRMPPVAVVLGSHNQSAFVEATIRSIAAQTYGDFECVIVDDCSTDDSAARIEAALAGSATRFRASSSARTAARWRRCSPGWTRPPRPSSPSSTRTTSGCRPSSSGVAAHLSERGQAAISASDLAVIDAGG